MLIVMGFYKRRPGWTWTQFSDYWRDVHGPLLRTPEIKRYLSRYVQHHLKPNESAQTTQPLDFDGFSEVWYKRAEDRTKLLAEPFFVERIVPDEAVFLDTSVVRTSVYDTRIVQFE